MRREFICEECQNSTLNKLESMLEILQTDTKQGTVTPTEIADNILNIMGKDGQRPFRYVTALYRGRTSGEGPRSKGCLFKNQPAGLVFLTRTFPSIQVI